MTTALIVLSHGLWGTKEHMEYIEGRLKDKYKDGVYIIMNTVESLKAKGEPLDKISLIGYSLGGLILRYAVGVLGQAGIFDTVTPHYFITFATPHLGVRSPSNSLFSKVFNYLSGTMVSRSGEQIQLVDHHGKENKPLLQIMSEPSKVMRE
ncbi:putative serine esterase-domain-containing protein [Pilobolus umbonatus]|nr:putative serine esterase-domain-containing protein [Pilobolus umbonatus]